MNAEKVESIKLSPLWKLRLHVFLKKHFPFLIQESSELEFDDKTFQDDGVDWLDEK